LFYFWAPVDRVFVDNDFEVMLKRSSEFCHVKEAKVLRFMYFCCGMGWDALGKTLVHAEVESVKQSLAVQ